MRLVPALVALTALAAAPLLHFQGLHLPCPYYAPIVDIPPANVPHPSPLEGPYAPNALLQTHAVKLFRGAEKPETVVVGDGGTAYLAVETGGAVLASSLEQHTQLAALAHTGGRPAGMALHPDGSLVVCDIIKGLLAVDTTSGAVRLLTSRVTRGSVSEAEAEILFADDPVVASDGRIFFSDATALPPRRLADGGFHVTLASKANLLEGKPSGRVLVYDPRDGSTSVVASGIWFANGVALSRDESFLVVAETFGARLLRVWLRGERAGETEVFLDGLPGLPDGVSASPDGESFWVAIVTRFTPGALALVRAPRSRSLRWAVARMPEALQPRIQPYGLVVQVAANGTALRSLHDPSGRACPAISAVTQAGGRLYLGSLESRWACAVDLGAL